NKRFPELGHNGRIASFSVDKTTKTFGDSIIQSVYSGTVEKDGLVQLLKGKVLVQGSWDSLEAWFVQFEPATGAFGASKVVTFRQMNPLVPYDSQFIYDCHPTWTTGTASPWIWQVDEDLNTKRIGPTHGMTRPNYNFVSPSGRIVISGGSMYVAEDT